MKFKMILEGELKIVHKEHYAKKLGQYHIDTFDGSWETSAEGKVIDFNVIYSDKIKTAEAKKLELTEGQKQMIESSDFTGIYVLSGSMKINNRELKEKDFILVEKETGTEKFDLTSTIDCKYILVSIYT